MVYSIFGNLREEWNVWSLVPSEHEMSYGYLTEYSISEWINEKTPTVLEIQILHRQGGEFIWVGELYQKISILVEVWTIH